MAKRTGKQTELKKLTSSLRDFVESLPTDSEKQELQRSVAAIIEFLSTIQRSLKETPTREDTVTMENAFRTLDSFAERAKSNSVISTLLGIPQPRLSRSKPAIFASEETAAAQQLVTEMQTWPIDQIRSRLQDEAAIPLRTLQAIALQLGIRSVQRMGRDVMEHQIASKISNYRGYQGLRTGTETA